jgi:hypothetical protein
LLDIKSLQPEGSESWLAASHKIWGSQNGSKACAFVCWIKLFSLEMPAGVPASPGGIEAVNLTALDHTDGLPLPIPRTTTPMPASRNDLAAVKVADPNSPYKATVAIFLAGLGASTWSVKSFISVVIGSLCALLEMILTCR